MADLRPTEQLNTVTAPYEKGVFAALQALVLVALIPFDPDRSTDRASGPILAVLTAALLALILLPKWM